VLAILALAGVTLVSVRFQPTNRPSRRLALVYLVIVVLLSLTGASPRLPLYPSSLWSFCRTWPRCRCFPLSVDEPWMQLPWSAFLTTALIITRLVSKMRGSLDRLRVSLEDLRRAEEATRHRPPSGSHSRHGVRARHPGPDYVLEPRRTGVVWLAAEEVAGRMAHELLRTDFPAPVEHIAAELNRSGRGEGELVHTRRNSSRVVVASRWSLQRDPDGRPVATPRDEQRHYRAQRGTGRPFTGQAELARVTRVTTLGELAASIAHEVNQPLTAIVADSNAALNWLAVQKPDLEIVRSTLIAIVKDSERAAKVFYPYSRYVVALGPALPTLRSAYHHPRDSADGAHRIRAPHHPC